MYMMHVDMYNYTVTYGTLTCILYRVYMHVSMDIVTCILYCNMHIVTCILYVHMNVAMHIVMGCLQSVDWTTGLDWTEPITFLFLKTRPQ